MYIDWYKVAKIQQEAGIKDMLPAALVMALIAVLGGSAIWNAAQKFNVEEDDIEQALSNPKVMQSLQKENYPEPKQLKQPEQPKQPELSNKPSSNPVTFDQILPTIFEHEGLLPKQTPFRIMNDTMRKWNTIHGFPIDKTTPVPKDRRNFFFLQDSDDVPKAIRQQFVNYYTNPTKYKLSSEPTLDEAIRKFDQENPDGKMKLILSNFPNIDFKIPLRNFF